MAFFSAASLPFAGVVERLGDRAGFANAIGQVVQSDSRVAATRQQTVQQAISSVTEGMLNALARFRRINIEVCDWLHVLRLNFFGRAQLEVQQLLRDHCMRQPVLR